MAATSGERYRGRLMPGRTALLINQLNSFRQSEREDLEIGVRILTPGPGECPPGEALATTIFPLNRVPSLPLPGCDRSPCCGCAYVAVPVQRSSARRRFGRADIGRRILILTGIVAAIALVFAAARLLR